MKTRIVCTLVALALAPASALAQTSSGSSSSDQTNASASSTTANHNTSVQAKVRKNLQSAGFTDIKIVPEGFLVQAKDKSGTPVMMIIDPNSISEFVGVGNSSASQKETSSESGSNSSGASGK